MPTLTWVTDVIARVEVRLANGNHQRVVFSKGTTFAGLDETDRYVARAIALGWLKVTADNVEGDN